LPLPGIHLPIDNEEVMLVQTIHIKGQRSFHEMNKLLRTRFIAEDISHFKLLCRHVCSVAT